MQTLKFVLVGDYEAGKTHLLRTYTSSDAFAYIHTIQSHSVTVTSRGKPVTLDLWDATSISDYSRVRPLFYPQTDMFLVCFSVVSPSSYSSVKQKWVPEITQHCPDARFLLVGTRTDLRGDRSVLEKLSENKQRPLQPADGERLAQQLKALKYLECSAETKEGLNEMFDEAVLIALGEYVTEKEKSKKCLLQ